MKPASLRRVTCVFLGTCILATPASIGADEGMREKIGEVMGKPVYRDELRREQSRVDELNRLFLAPVLAKYRDDHRAEFTPSELEIEAARKVFHKQQVQQRKDREAEVRDELQAVVKLLQDRDRSSLREQLESKRTGLESELRTLEDEDAEVRDLLQEVVESLQEPDLPADARAELESLKKRYESELQTPGQMLAKFVLVNWKFQLHLYKNFGGGRLLWQQGGIEAVDAMRSFIETQERKGAFKIADEDLRERFYSEWTALESDPFVIKDKERIRAEFLEPEWALSKATAATASSLPAPE